MNKFKLPGPFVFRPYILCYLFVSLVSKAHATLLVVRYQNTTGLALVGVVTVTQGQAGTASSWHFPLCVSLFAWSGETLPL